MDRDEHYMQVAINFAKAKNKIWPFAALIVDMDTNKILVKATDCAHISPVFHAESCAIHYLALNFDYKKYKNLAIYSTSECDLLSAGSILTAVITGYNIKKLVFGVSQQEVCQIWGYDYFDTSRYLRRLETRSGILKNECAQLLYHAKNLQNEINVPHPGKAVLSKDVESFYEIIAQ